MFAPIAGDGNAARFDLRRQPNGVYLIDGRAIPTAYDTALGIDDAKPVVLVHDADNSGVRLLWGELGVDPKQRELELPPNA